MSLLKLTDVKKNKGELQVKDLPEVQRVYTLDRYCPELSSGLHQLEGTGC